MDMYAVDSTESREKNPVKNITPSRIGDQASRDSWFSWMYLHLVKTRMGFLSCVVDIVFFPKFHYIQENQRIWQITGARIKISYLRPGWCAVRHWSCQNNLKNFNFFIFKSHWIQWIQRKQFRVLQILCVGSNLNKSTGGEMMKS